MLIVVRKVWCFFSTVEPGCSALSFGKVTKDVELGAELSEDIYCIAKKHRSFSLFYTPFFLEKFFTTRFTRRIAHRD